MRRVNQSLVLFIIGTVSYAASGQVSITMQNGKPQKAVVGLPFSADQTIRTVQHLANGTPLTHQMRGHVYRSADGIERYDGTFPSTDAAHPDPVTMAIILDPAKHVYTLLNSRLMTASVTHVPIDATASVAFLPLPRGAGVSGQPAKPENATTTDLGKRTQNMMPLLGKRITSTIPAGKIGNDQPLFVTVDAWFAPQLKIVVSEAQKDPIAGERTFELTNIRSEEPDPTLFEIPEGYTVEERPTMPLLGQPISRLPEERTKQIEDALNESDPRVKNSVAYALANNNDHLADAQTLAEQASLIQEKKSAEIVSAGDVTEAFTQMVVLASYWDTVGWVYFRAGNQEKAEAYVRAAWELKPNPEFCSHLGRIYEAQHRPKEATAIYRMALSSKNSPAAQDFFQTRLANLGAESAIPLPDEATTPLPSFNLQLAAGEAEPVVDILLASDKPAQVSLINGKLAHISSLTQAIQSALAKDLPDTGPEEILRRARVNCTTGQAPLCTLHFINSDSLKVR